MGSSVLSALVCVLCVVLLPVVWAEYCTSFRDVNGHTYTAQQCYNQFCCGNCNQRYCCGDPQYRLSLSQQQRCSDSTGHDKKNKLGTLLGSILGSIFPILLCVGLVICCVAPCCLFYKKCRKGGNRGQRNSTVISTPGQPNSPSGYPGYHPVPGQPGFGGLPNPSAPPPSYFDANNPHPHPAPFTPGQPMYPLQPYAAPPHSDGGAQPPFNPSYGPNL